MNQEKVINRALALVRDGLRSGGIPAHNFDMGNWRDYMTVARGPHCGSVCCIGGWTQTLLQKAGMREAAYEVEVDMDDDLQDLFYGRAHASAKEAADAIDRYLTGEEPWPRRTSLNAEEREP